MNILSVLLFLVTIRTCTKESASFDRKKAVEGSISTAPIASIPSPDHDTVIITLWGVYLDDLRTRGLPSLESTKLIASPTFAPEFYKRFIYPEIALQSRVEGSCIVQFAIDTASTIQYFSVLQTDSKLFSDEVRHAIMSKPVTFNFFPDLPKGQQTVRVEIKVSYKLKAVAKM
jgi:outer membrane biosynthesis protein TonB